MLGKNVTVTVTEPIGHMGMSGIIQPLNFARIDNTDQYAYIIGVDHVISYFDGKVVAALIPKEKSGKKNTAYKKRAGITEPLTPDGNKKIWIVAQKKSRVIAPDIKDYIDFKNEFANYYLMCLYESSAGAVVYKQFNDKIKYLLIKNKRSDNWGFPKGHIEQGETKYDAAKREVLEETGLHIKIHLGYEGISKYKIHDIVDKQVSIFAATTKDTETIIQHSEIDEYVWLPFDQAMPFLRFPNDKRILFEAVQFLVANKYIIDKDRPNPNAEEREAALKKKRRDIKNREARKKAWENRKKKYSKDELNPVYEDDFAKSIRAIEEAKKIADMTPEERKSAKRKERRRKYQKARRQRKRAEKAALLKAEEQNGSADEKNNVAV